MKLRRKRNTRFVSVHKLFASYVLNHPILKGKTKVAGAVALEFRAVAGSRKQDIERQDRVLKSIHSDPLVARAARAEKLHTPIARFCRAAGMWRHHASAAFPLWTQLEQALSDAAARFDFPDRPKGETPQTKTQRAAALSDMLAKRRADFLKPVHHAAYLLDPRNHELKRQAELGDLDTASLGYDPVDLFQKSKTAAHKFVKSSFPEPARQREAAAEFDAFLAKAAPWTEVEFPGPEDSSSMVVWWRSRAPTTELHNVATKALSITLTAGAAEVTWGMLTRDAVPVRNRLSMATKNMLVDLRWNAEYSLRRGESLSARRTVPAPIVIPDHVALAEPFGPEDEDAEVVSSSASDASSESGEGPAADDAAVEAMDVSEGEDDLDLGF